MFSCLLETERGASVKTILVSNVQPHHYEDVAIIPFMVKSYCPAQSYKGMNMHVHTSYMYMTHVHVS